MYRLFKSQLKNIFLTKSYKIMMFIIWGCIVCVYIMNVKDYYGYELSQMQSYVEISSISSFSLYLQSYQQACHILHKSCQGLFR